MPSIPSSPPVQPLAAPPSSSRAGRTRAPALLRAAAVLGVLWNAFGVFQFVRSVGATREQLIADGLTAAAADLYLGLPSWMTVAFAAGVFGGLLGSLALAARRRAAVPVLATSLAAYAALFAGDAALGVFAAIPGQAAILSLVLAIAVALAAAGGFARRSGWLR